MTQYDVSIDVIFYQPNWQNVGDAWWRQKRD